VKEHLSITARDPLRKASDADLNRSLGALPERPNWAWAAKLKFDIAAKMKLASKAF
jgi:hypothetical protein